MLNNNILIEEYKEEEKFGISMEHTSVKAKVLDVGPEVNDVKVDDIVYMSKYSGLPYKDLRIVTEYDILGIEG